MNNIAPKEAVEVIKKYRVDGKKMYIQNKVTDDASGLKEVKEKLIELEEINTTASSDIKWEHIRTEEVIQQDKIIVTMISMMMMKMSIIIRKKMFLLGVKM
ncbi:hypothetical protein RhiirA5_444891 [Rhizophagus irregularis]|uniref:Uncharacterized protein n=1 Tax=Rhizophagus irregularis TaxID=588596 RepID=A0A2N0NCT2_9GLOM|nr:hypothetical protein RhiirA5_444891 [Rhizophagus irregularis]